MLDYIRALFEDLEGKVRFLEELYESGRQDEAVTLCCVYIDGLGNSLWPDENSNRNFVRALIDYGGQPQLALLHPLALIRWLAALKDRPKLHALAPKLEAAFGPAPKAMSELAFRQVLTGVLTKDELRLIDKELWRASIAAIAYQRVRLPWVHRLRGYGAVLVGEYSANGSRLKPIHFPLLCAALKNVVQGARTLSEQSGKFFGHDFRLPKTP